MLSPRDRREGVCRSSGLALTPRMSSLGASGLQCSTNKGSTPAPCAAAFCIQAGPGKRGTTIDYLRVYCHMKRNQVLLALAGRGVKLHKGPEVRLTRSRMTSRTRGLIWAQKPGPRAHYPRLSWEVSTPLALLGGCIHLLLNLLRWAMGALPVPLAVVLGREVSSEQWFGRYWERRCQDVPVTCSLPLPSAASARGLPTATQACLAPLLLGKERFAFI